MVQTAHISSFGSGVSTPKPYEILSAELGRLLQRLQQSTLHSDPVRERRLRTSEYERAKLQSNLEYAREVLTSLEQDALSLKAPGRKAEAQSDLNHKREALNLLFERLEDIKQVANDDEDDDSSDGEDLFEGVVATETEDAKFILQGASHEQGATAPLLNEMGTAPEQPSETKEASPRPVPSQQPFSSSSPSTDTYPTQTLQYLRSRTSEPSQSPNYSTSRAALFASRRKVSSPLASAPETSTATATAILERQRGEQEALTDSMLDLAKRLKESTRSIHTELEADKEVVGKAGEGLDKTERTMESATGRMGVLRKMTEGEGWWGRMMLWARIGVMMIVILLIMFVMPKLRF